MCVCVCVRKCVCEFVCLYDGMQLKKCIPSKLLIESIGNNSIVLELFCFYSDQTMDPLTHLLIHKHTHTHKHTNTQTELYKNTHRSRHAYFKIVNTATIQS